MGTAFGPQAGYGPPADLRPAAAAPEVPEEPDAPAARLDQTAWNELAPLLDGRPLPPFAYAAYRWAFEVTGCAVPAPRGLPAPDLAGVARDLDGRRGRRPDLPLPLPFVRHLAARAAAPGGDPAWARAAGHWVDATRARLGAAPVPAPPGPPREAAALHVRLAEDVAEQDRYWVRMWLHRAGAGFENWWESERPLTLPEARSRLGEHLRAAAERDPDEAPCRVELHLPQHLLTAEDYASWQLPIGRRGRPLELGSHYEVVLRCPEEREGVPATHWRRKWRWFRAQGGSHPEAARRVADADVTPRLSVALQAGDPPVCVLAEVSSERLLQEALDVMLDAGVPIAVWQHGLAGPAPEGGDEPVWPGRLAALADADLDALPALLRKRRTPGAPRPLVLLWDDPERVPERRSLA